MSMFQKSTSATESTKLKSVHILMLALAGSFLIGVLVGRATAQMRITVNVPERAPAPEKSKPQQVPSEKIDNTIKHEQKVAVNETV